MVATSVRAPGVSVMRSCDDLVDHRDRQALRASATRSRSAGSKAISPRMARSVIAATCGLQADEVGELVDAFLPDHGGIHVGEEQLLAPLATGCTTTSIAGPSATRSRFGDVRVGRVGAFRAKGNVGGDAGRRASAGAPALRQRRVGARERGIVERAVGRDQGCDMSHADAPADKAVLIAGPTASGKSALALALAEKHRRRRSSMPIRCRSIAICASSRRGRRRRTSAARRTGSTAMSTPRENYSVGRWLRDVARRAATRRAPPAAADPRRRHRALFQGADRRGSPRCRRSPATSARDVRGAPARPRASRALHAELLARDPATAHRLMPSDRSRIARALEVLEATGRSLTDWHRDGHAAADRSRRARPRSSSTCERSELVRAHRRRASTRCSTAGALEEVRALAARGLDPLLPAMKAHRRAVADPASAAARSRSTRPPAGADHGHPPLRQAPGHLVPQPDAGLALGAAEIRPISRWQANSNGARSRQIRLTRHQPPL